MLVAVMDLMLIDSSRSHQHGVVSEVCPVVKDWDAICLLQHIHLHLLHTT